MADLDRVGVVGAGTMGMGIAQVALGAGHEVWLHDVDRSATARARARIREGLARQAARLDLDADSIDDWVEGRFGGLRVAEDLDELAVSDIVIEAAVEDLATKRDIIRALDTTAPRDTILATNTSALSVAEISERADDPGRILGLHFFNPAPVMALVEVVVAPSTRPAVADRAVTLMESWGKVPIRCEDTPGFIVNRVNRPFTLEALRILDAGEAGVGAIDSAMRDAGYPMGPFQLMDLVGIDVNLAAAESIWERMGSPDRLRPSPTQYVLVDEGRLGRKTGRGFYRYDEEGHPVGPAVAEVETGPLDAGIVRRIETAIHAEATLAAEEGVASPDDIDRAMRLGAAHPMGPFERRRERHGTMPA